MATISKAGLTLNPKKCQFGKKSIGVYGADGVKPDPIKVEALDFITPPKSKEDLISFLCMMQTFQKNRH